MEWFLMIISGWIILFMIDCVTTKIRLLKLMLDLECNNIQDFLKERGLYEEYLKRYR